MKEVMLIGRKCRPGERVRVAVRYADAWRPIFWMTVEKQGDVLFGPRFTGKRPIEGGTMHVQEGVTSVSVNYEDAEPQGEDISKVTLHTSGIANLGAGRRMSLSSLRTLDRQREVGLLLFGHPGSFTPVDALRSRDAALDYPIDEARPLEGRLVVAPLDRWEGVEVPDATHQMNVLLECRGLGQTPDLAVQFVLSTGEEGPWPPATVSMFVDWVNTNEERLNPLRNDPSP